MSALEHFADSPLGFAVGVGTMYRITPAYFMRLGEQIQRLRAIQEGSKVDYVQHIIHSAVETFMEVQANRILGHSLRATYGPLHELIESLRSIDVNDSERKLTWFDIYKITEPLKGFYQVFGAEIQVAPAYLVLNKGAFDTQRLLELGETLFPSDLLVKVPLTFDDARAAGKCLAFELGTACGFHVLRVVESVMLKYWEVLSGGKPPPEPRGMGSILRELHKADLGDKDALAAIRQINTLHRNPLMHPEDHLEVEEAVALVGMAHSAIRVLLRAIPEPEVSEIANQENA